MNDKSVVDKRVILRKRVARNSLLGFVFICALSAVHTMMNADLLGIIELLMTVCVSVITYSHIIESSVKLQEIEDFVVQCAWCGGVRSAHEYVKAKVSHSICPSCYERELSDDVRITKTVNNEQLQVESK